LINRTFFKKLFIKVKLIAIQVLRVKEYNFVVLLFLLMTYAR